MKAEGGRSMAKVSFSQQSTHRLVAPEARLLGAALWSREESPRRVDAEKRLWRCPGCLPKVADIAAFDFLGGQTYWYNTQTGVSQWESPPAA